jgi:hypothetical protein
MGKMFRPLLPLLLLPLALLLVGCTQAQGAGEHGRYSSTFVHWVYQTRPIPDEIEAVLLDVSADPSDPTVVPRLRELANRQSFVNIQLRGVDAPPDLQRYHDVIIGATLRFEAEIAALRDGPLPSTPLAAVQQLKAAERLLLDFVIGCYTKLETCSAEAVS